MIKKINITSGPSREELFDSLRLSKQTTFKFKTEFYEWKATIFVGAIKHIQRRQDWEIEFLMTISENVHFGSQIPKKPKILVVLANYSTDTRKGEVEITVQ